MKNHLVINIGSSSVKISLYKKKGRNPFLILEGVLFWSEKIFHYTYQGDPKKHATKALKKTKKDTILALLKNLKKEPYFDSLASISHRIVHGGPSLSQSCSITEKVKSTLKKLSSLAPLHNPLELAVIEITESLWPKALQFAHFDTAFFQKLPPLTQTLPLPQSLCKEEIKRYGFHGLSHESSFKKLSQKDPQSKSSKIIICHLGNGCSLSALSKQKCVDTTMGFTPLDGLIMGTRTGSLDPGVLLYLLEEKKVSIQDLREILQNKSGLLGISNQSSNLEELLKISAVNVRAKLAIDMFVLSLAKHICAMMASLNGCDHLIFTGGIGENLPIIRSKTIKKLAFLGLEITPQQKINLDYPIISTKKSKAKIWVFKSCENAFIAQTSFQLFSM